MPEAQPRPRDAYAEALGQRYPSMEECGMSLCKRCKGPTMLTEPATQHRDYRTCYEYVVKENAMLSGQIAALQERRLAQGTSSETMFADPKTARYSVPSWREVHRALREP